MKEAAGVDDDDGADVEDLWFVEERTDVAVWLAEHGWEVTSFEAAELMTRYGREQPDAASPRTVFVEGLRVR
jgi:O-methyltransferase involved in polyketide biosynthesis